MLLTTLNSNLILLIPKCFDNSQIVATALNSNLILLIPETILDGQTAYVDFKFQSDSINTFLTDDENQ